jgi:2-haloacid dehalogenase
MPLSDFKVLSFGCYGTLINRNSGIYSALRPLLARGETQLSREQALAQFTEYETLQQAEAPCLPFPQVLAEVHRRLAKKWGIVAAENDHARFAQSPSNWPLYADAPPALRYLKRFFKLAILTNADRQTFRLANLRLEATFDAIFTGPEIGRCKPDPKPFEHMVERLARLGVERRQILHVAHSLQRDQAPASRCELAFAWIDRAPGNASAHPTWEYRFASLVDMVKAHQQG